MEWHRVEATKRKKLHNEKACFGSSKPFYAFSWLLIETLSSTRVLGAGSEEFPEVASLFLAKGARHIENTHKVVLLSHVTFCAQ